jgi:hypothetical protein
MMPEKWENIKGSIKDKFKVEDSGKEHIEDEGGADIEYIVFNGPLGKIRLEHISKPIVLDKKTVFSRRIGSETAVDYVYSEDEKSHKLIAYKWDENNDEWEEIDSGMFN